MNNELPNDRAKAVEAGLAQYHQVSHERDELRKQINDATQIISRLKVELDALHQQYNLIESRMKTFQAERDQAVAERACYETLFLSVQQLLRTFTPAAQPLVKEKPHDDHVEEAISDYHKRKLANLANSLKTVRVPMPEQGPGQG